MSSVDCPRCEESFRVPDAPLPDGIRLRCPWCSEMFRPSDLAQRLSPMVELIGEDDQPVEISSLLSVPHSASVPSATSSWGEHSSTSAVAYPGPYGETLPAFEAPTRLEPGETDIDTFAYADDDDQSQARGSNQTAALDPSADATALESNEFDDSLESNPAALEEFEAFEPSESYDEPIEEDYDEYQVDPTSGERLPITGPVAPTPLSAIAARDFGNAAVAMAPRKRTKSSPIKSAVKMILGGIAGLALGGAILEFVGRPLFWPFDGTISGKIKSNSPMVLSDNQATRRANPGRSLAEDLPPGSVDAPPETPASDPVTPEVALSPIQAPAPLIEIPKSDTPTSDTPTSDTPTSDTPTSDTGATTPPGSAAPAEEPAMSALPATTATDAPLALKATPDQPPKLDSAVPRDATDTPLAPATGAAPAMPAAAPDSDKASLDSDLPAVPPVSESPPMSESSSSKAAPSTVERSSSALTMPVADAAPSDPAATVETSQPDASRPDASRPDASRPDASRPDATRPQDANEGLDGKAAPKQPASSPELISAIKQTDAALKAVVEFADQSDAGGLRTSKASLYVALANLAMHSQDWSQPETGAVIDRIADANLINDMKKAAPPWLRYLKRPNEGLFAAGTVIRQDGDWVLQWNGETNLQLQNVDSASIQSGDQVMLLGTIIDANPPAIVRVVYLKK